jgi:2-polyprenyl-3-methyl-5-hydroxy-6-metoxy-1,4-benzoquinol methylase
MTDTQAAASAAVPQPRPAAQPTTSVDPSRLDELLGRVVTDLGGALAAPAVLIGDRLGLFTALDGAGSLTADELAGRTGLTPRYVREWLLTMAASGYVDYAGDDRFRLSPEQAEVLAHPDSPAYAAGGFQNMVAATRVLDRLTDAFRTGAGIGWHEHHPDMFEGTERFFRPGYLAHLTTEWIPAFDGLAERLGSGATVADVGCGLGASTQIMAEAYPASAFVGIDYHEPSVRMARERTHQAGLDERLRFEVGTAQQVTGAYDLVALFDCLHDMPDPLAALRAVRAAVKPDGWVMLVEPASGDTVEDVLNPLGRLFIAASTFICLPSGLSAEPRAGLGNQAGPTRTLALAREAGFTHVREASRTPFNIIYELRP